MKRPCSMKRSGRGSGNLYLHRDPDECREKVLEKDACLPAFSNRPYRPGLAPIVLSRDARTEPEFVQVPAQNHPTRYPSRNAVGIIELPFLLSTPEQPCQPNSSVEFRRNRAHIRPVI